MDLSALLARLGAGARPAAAPANVSGRGATRATAPWAGPDASAAETPLRLSPARLSRDPPAHRRLCGSPTSRLTQTPAPPPTPPPPPRPPLAPQGALASIKAGKLHSDREGDAQMRLRADPRRGELRVHRDAQGVVHLTWRDRATGAVEDDLSLFPNDVTLRRVVTPTPADRVYELAFAQGARRPSFFWLQAADAAKDADEVAALLGAINDRACP